MMRAALPAVLALALACALLRPGPALAQSADPNAPAGQPASAPSASAAAQAEPKGWSRFKAEMRDLALAEGVTPATLDIALSPAKFLPRVIELDRKQPEGRLSLERYIKNAISDARVRQGQEQLRANAAALARTSEATGVPANIIVALWAVESGFGRNMGKFKVVDAVATLAFEGRRGEMFRQELLAALQILEAGHIPPERMLGSWAGAMGQIQFMPTSFLRRARDGDGDGHADIWGNRADVIASAANFLADAGWRRGERWGRIVQVPRGINRDLIGGPKKSVDDWAALGVRLADGQPLPKSSDILAQLLQPDGPGTLAILAYHNFSVIKKWNNSNSFAAAVGLLADRFDG